MIRCELCDKAATLSVTTYTKDGEVSERHSYCGSHGNAPVRLPEQETCDFRQQAVVAIRALADFIKRNSRLPTGQECHDIGYPAAIGPLVSRSTSPVAEQLAFLEFLADFIEKNGRYPEADERPADRFHVRPV
jgi:hypothetical protein